MVFQNHPFLYYCEPNFEGEKLLIILTEKVGNATQVIEIVFKDGINEINKENGKDKEDE